MVEKAKFNCVVESKLPVHKTLGDKKVFHLKTKVRPAQPASVPIKILKTNDLEPKNNNIPTLNNLVKQT